VKELRDTLPNKGRLNMGLMGFGRNRPACPEIAPPDGRIRTREELRDLIIEARKERKAIRIYLVEQSGHMSQFFLTSKSRLEKPEHEHGLCSGDNFYSVKGKKLAGWERRLEPKHRYYSDRILCGSYGIGVQQYGGSPHYAFTNRILAERYSLFLKTHKAYAQYVRDWHAYCANVFH
jgi:hypothetical protein